MKAQDYLREEDYMEKPESKPVNMVKLPSFEDVYLCPITLQRWFHHRDDSWERDLNGEDEWRKMASYVDKTYEEVAKGELEYAKRRLKESTRND